MAKNLSPKKVDSLINQALAIEDSEAKESGSLGFMARAMVQATLPHRKVAGNEFTRTNGDYTLTIMAPSHIGLPYGSIPRLLLAWVTTEAVKTQSKELELGDSMSAFMAELGMTATGGSSGSINRLKQQTRSLFNSTVSATYAGMKVDDAGYRLAEKTSLWWNTREPNQAGLWQSSVLLTDTFFKELIDRPIPIDMRALKALKQSPMALDIYTWLTYRVSYLKRPTVIPWELLAMQFGSNYAELRFFKRAFLEELRKVMTVYTHVKVEGLDDGLQVLPSLTHIPMKKDRS